MGSKVWKAAELARLTPEERIELSKATVVYDIDEAPEHVLKTARESVYRHIAKIENDDEAHRSWPTEKIVALKAEEIATFMSFIRSRDYDAIDRMLYA